MARRPGLTPARVVDAAAALADEQGLDALTLGAVATALGVRGPSLYNHVDGLDDLRRRLTLRAVEESTGVLQEAAVGRSGADAVRAMAHAYRGWAKVHPGLHAATVPTTETDDDEIRAAGRRSVDTALAVLSGFDLDADAAIHAARTLRAAIHGFTVLENAGGFGLEQAVDDSFAWLVELFVAGLAGLPATPRSGAGDRT